MPTSKKTELQSRIERYLKSLSAEATVGYVTYAIKEPVSAWRHLEDGIPFYVGETSNLARRARQHFLRGGAPTNDRQSVYWHIYRLLAADRIPRFVVLERTTTRASSLESETRWAQHFLEQGYVLANRWSEHKAGKNKVLVPSKRLWAFTLAEALADDLTLQISCRRCKTSALLPLESVMKATRPTIKLQDLRRTVSCPSCGFIPCLCVSSASRPVLTEEELDSTRAKSFEVKP